MSVKNESGDEVTIVSRQLESFTTDSNQSYQESNRPKSNLSMSSAMSPVDHQHHLDDKLKMPKSCHEKNYLIDGKVPVINVPEKILFIIDTTKEATITPYEFESGKTIPPLKLIKRAVEMFIHAKSTINRSHEFAIMTLSAESPSWLCDFTNNIKQVINVLNSITDSPLGDEDQHICDLTQCFGMALDKIDLQQHPTIPTYVTRVIFIYGRSQIITSISDPVCFDLLVKHPHFFLDALFVHEPPSDDDDCEKIYGELQRFDTKENSFILEVGRVSAALFSSMARLVAHPLQRPKQNETDYNISLPNNSTDV
ncbi:BRISC and BRCA1-A complex member 1 [Microplitis demolitor]|uniref:BRISC and BRCA1-A complex member 1 n=1 Tax=Microplitis demolitor TaxID=69319 RepID=UPI0004CD47A1|nr:BRISC and BRCA1-A complex member 1 [Microplitis demolitor]